MKCSVCNKDLLPEGFEIDVRQVNALTPKHYQEAFSNYCTCNQPKPEDKHCKTCGKDNCVNIGADLIVSETPCPNWRQPKPTDKPDSQLTDTDGTDCIKQMISDEAFEEWFDKAWGTAEMGISKHVALQDAFTAGFKAGALSERKVVIDKIVRWASKKKDGEAFILSGRGAKTEDMDLEVLDYPHHYCIDAMDDLIKYLNDQTKEVL